MVLLVGGIDMPTPSRVCWRRSSPILVANQFPDGDHAQLLAGIRSKLFSLPDETILLPGHGPTRLSAKNKNANSSSSWEFDLWPPPCSSKRA